MSRAQRIHLQMWVVLFTLVVVVTVLQEYELWVRLAFVPVGVYFVLNIRNIRSIEAVGPSIGEVMDSNRFVRYYVWAALSIEIVAAYYAVLTGSALGRFVSGFGSLILVALFPSWPLLLVQQVQQYHRLKNHIIPLL